MGAELAVLVGCFRFGCASRVLSTPSESLSFDCLGVAHNSQHARLRVSVASEVASNALDDSELEEVEP